MLNRVALIVRPAEPYLDWARGLGEAGAVPDPNGEQTVYLVPELDCLEDLEEALPEMFTHIFELELHGWHTDEEAWPVDRSLAAFKQWFHAELHTVVEDLCGDPLLDEE